MRARKTSARKLTSTTTTTTTRQSGSSGRKKRIMDKNMTLLGDMTTTASSGLDSVATTTSVASDTSGVTKPQTSASGKTKMKKTKGRVKIKMEFIENKIRRYTTFSKRKTGIMKKVNDFFVLFLNESHHIEVLIIVSLIRLMNCRH